MIKAQVVNTKKKLRDIKEESNYLLFLFMYLKIQYLTKLK